MKNHQDIGQHLDPAVLAKLTQIEDVRSAPVEALVRLFREEIPAGSLPERGFQVDPRSGIRVLYSASRAVRPHDNRAEHDVPTVQEKPCAICEGRTTGVVDVAPLSEGFTFINKNLYPAVFPFEGFVAEAQDAFGLHFLQWTSSIHTHDWHNMPIADLVIVLGRLAALEAALMFADQHPPAGGMHFLVIKNFGHSVGASLAHGHQQILWTNVAPGIAGQHRRFEAAQGERFSAFVLRQTSDELVVRDYGPAVLLVPPFMRRPYQMMLVIKETTRRHLTELAPQELEALAQGWHDATRALHHIMPAMGREVAYNIIGGNGAGGGLYFELLPYTQEMGGLEHLGLYICQETPGRAAARLRSVMDEPDPSAAREA